MYFAHETEELSDNLGTKLGSALQHPGVAFPLISLIAVLLMLGSLWLLKRYTTWQFPSLSKSKGKH